MSSNSAKMSVEDILVQDLKENRLGALIGDEEALGKLASRAINEALFNPRYETEGSGYSSRQVQKPPLIIEEATKVAKKALEKIVEDQIKAIMDNPATYEAIQKAFAGLFPSMLLRMLDQQAVTILNQAQSHSVMALQSALTAIGDPKLYQVAQDIRNLATVTQTDSRLSTVNTRPVSE